MQKLFKGLIVFIMLSLLIPSLLAGCSSGGPAQSPATDNGNATSAPANVSAATMESGASQESAAITYKTPDLSSIIAYDGNPWLNVPVNMVMVLVKEGTGEADVLKLADDLGGKIVGKFDYIGMYQIETNSTTQKDLDGMIKKAADYAFVQKSGPMVPEVGKDVIGKPCRILEDIYSDKKAASSYEMIGLERAYDLINASGVTLNKVTVGVVDDGLNAESSDGKNDNRIAPLDKSDLLTGQDDFNNHGTMTSNVVGASWDNSGMRGVAGGLKDKLQVNVVNKDKGNPVFKPITVVDPNNPAHVVLNSGSAFDGPTFEKILDQVKSGATVINCSFGSAYPGKQNAFANEAYRKFLSRMENDYPKVLFVAAAGNEGYMPKKDAAGNETWVKGTALDGNNYSLGGTKADNLITVGALNSDGTNAWFTNTATGNGEVTLAAQGSEVAVSEKKDGTVEYANGTSFAAPQVTGAAAVLKSINPNLTAKEIKDILVNTADTKITNPNLLAAGKKEQAIDPGVGGRVMRLDNAVIDQLKKVMGDKFDLKALENIAKILAKAISDKSDPLHFTIDANVPAVKDTGTDINVTFNGEGSLGGLSTQHIGAAGSLTWDWRFITDKNSASIKVTRMDSGACSNISLKPNAMAGTYKGNLHVAFPAYAQMMSKTAFDIPSTIVIDDAGGVKFTYADKGSVSQGANGVSITVDYDAGGTMDGTATAEGVLTFSGGYSSTYNTKIPGGYAAMMPAAQRAMLSGTTSGSSDGTGTLVDTTITGSVVFNGAQGGSSTGTFKVEKVEE